jgi:alkylhydroperoxidase family enzyme
VTLEDDLVRRIQEDYTTAPLTPADRLMLDYVVQLTRDATRICSDYHEALRAAGFDDRAILQMTLIASWFNYINRVADALGVGRD